MNFHLSNSEGLDHKYLYNIKQLKFLYEGDGYYKEHRYLLAKNMYEAQIITIRSKKPIDIKALAICHNKLGKVFLTIEVIHTNYNLCIC